jgi:pimeloyl-ACP methyl ester carboxylesterase
VLWCDADRIVDVDYGRTLAAGIPGARFELLSRTGHVPQMETPEVLLEALRSFVALHDPGSSLAEPSSK